MSFGLLDHTITSIYQDQGGICRRSSGYHITCILDVPRCIGNNKFTFGCCKVPVGNIDGDPLFSLISQAICKKR